MSPKSIPETLTGLLSRALRPALRRLASSSLPSLDGTAELPGLDGPVEILRDRFGVPQIFARSEHDLFFAQGYVHAQDRFFQMELQRRAGHGRLAEILGEDALPFDRLARTIGFARIALSVEKSSEVLRMIEAYSAGINACIEAEPLPPELPLLRSRPEPWTPLDTAAWSLVMAWSLSSSWESKLLMSSAGQEDLLPQTDPGAGSNAWAVAPSRSATGSALLAGDPHLSLGIPCLWYELGLYGGPYRVVGASLPGTPGVVIGHNEEIAWSVTAALTDVQDLYAERFSTGDPRLYHHRGEWHEAEVREETIRIRGRREPFVQTVRTTVHGPIVSDAIARDSGRPKDLALRWATPDPAVLVESGLAVNRARDKGEFLTALDGWTTPNQNFVYADRAGNVGWALAGLVPVRRGFRGDRILSGPSGEHEWDGFLRSAHLPRLFDPGDGQVASANEPPPDADRIPGSYLAPYRKGRISTLLTATEKHTLESFREIQGDLYCEPAHALARELSRLAPSRESGKEIMRELASWDGRLTADSRPGAVARVAFEHLIRRAAGDVNPLGYPVPNGVATYFGELVPGLMEGLDRLPQRVLASTLEDAVSTLSDTLGSNPEGWSWGALHAAELRHPLGVVRVLRSLLNRGPFPIGGDANTVRHAAFGQGKSDDRGHPRFGPVARGPNYRFVVDTGDWDNAWSVVAPGQSGHPASPHYDDELNLWLDIRYRPMVYGRRSAEIAARHRLVLRPTRGG